MFTMIVKAMRNCLAATLLSIIWKRGYGDYNKRQVYLFGVFPKNHSILYQLLNQVYYVLRRKYICINQLYFMLLYSYIHNGSANCWYSYYFNGKDCAGKNAMMHILHKCNNHNIKYSVFLIS